jgi:hypothetical protein
MKLNRTRGVDIRERLQREAVMLSLDAREEAIERQQGTEQQLQGGRDWAERIATPRQLARLATADLANYLHHPTVDDWRRFIDHEPMPDTANARRLFIMGALQARTRAVQNPSGI